MINAIIIQVIKNKKPTKGFAPIRKPMKVATPLPPLNFNQIGKIWPRIAVLPMNKIISSDK